MAHVGVEGTGHARRNVAQIIEGHDAERVALIAGGRETTYGELRDQVGRLRGGLAAAGVGPGDRVAMLCGNNRPFVLGYLATVGLGAVVVPLNPASPAPEIERELAAVEPVAVLVGPSAVVAWGEVDRSALPSIRTVVLAEERAGGPAGDATLDELLEHDPHPVAPRIVGRREQCHRGSPARHVVLLAARPGPASARLSSTRASAARRRR